MTLPNEPGDCPDHLRGSRRKPTARASTACWPTPSASTEALERAIELDPNFALAHSQLGLFHLFRGNGKRAAELANQAHELADRATPREQRHAAILGATARGKASEAPALVDEHLRETPRDAPILLQWFGATSTAAGSRNGADAGQI